MIVALCITALIVSVMAIVIAVYALIEVPDAVRTLTANGTELRQANHAQAQTIQLLRSDLTDADAYRMEARRIEHDTRRNIQARPGALAAVVSDADLEAPGLVKQEDLYIDQPDPAQN